MNVLNGKEHDSNHTAIFKNHLQNAFHTKTLLPSHGKKKKAAQTK